MYKVVLLRHGESTWNMENRFTGWTDVDLSERGFAEAHRAGHLLKTEGYIFDVAFTSVLKRAIRTLWVTLDEMDLMWIPIHHSWRLNERHYGALQGLNKAETAAKYGDAQVKIWRRSYDIRPPALTRDDPRWPGRDPRSGRFPRPATRRCFPGSTRPPDRDDASRRANLADRRRDSAGMTPSAGAGRAATSPSMAGGRGRGLDDHGAMSSRIPVAIG